MANNAGTQTGTFAITREDHFPGMYVEVHLNDGTCRTGRLDYWAPTGIRVITDFAAHKLARFELTDVAEIRTRN
jgi:hypothetical protein